MEICGGWNADQQTLNELKSFVMPRINGGHKCNVQPGFIIFPNTVSQKRFLFSSLETLLKTAKVILQVIVLPTRVTLLIVKL